MGTALVTQRFSSPDALRRASTRLRMKAAEVGTGPNGKDILRVDDHTGDISFGQDKRQVTENDVWAVNPLSFTHGWIAFHDSEVMSTIDGRPADITLSLYDADLPAYEDLPELDYVPPASNRRGPAEAAPDWREKLGVEMLCIEGPNEGAAIIWSPTSYGGRRTIAKLFEMVANQLDSDDPELCVPIGELFSDSYYNKRFKRDVHGIEFHFLEWDNMDGSGIAGAEEAAKERAKEAARDRAPSTATKHPGRGERTRSGEPADTRRSRDAEDADYVEEQPTRGRGGRAKPSDEELREKGRQAREERYDPEAEQQEEEQPRRGRGGRGARQEAAPPASGGRGSRAPRDEDGGVEDPQPVARGRRGGRDAGRDDAAPAEDRAERGSVRGRNAGRGGRR